MLFLLLLLFKTYFLMCKKGISGLLRQVAPKPTAKLMPLQPHDQKNFSLKIKNVRIF